MKTVDEIMKYLEERKAVVAREETLARDCDDWEKATEMFIRLDEIFEFMRFMNSGKEEK